MSEIQGRADQLGAAATVSTVINALRAKFDDHKLSSAQLWLDLGHLIDKQAVHESDNFRGSSRALAQRFSRADRRQVFWDAHSQLGKWLLVNQHPAFAPENSLWKEGDSAAISSTDELLTGALRASDEDTVTSMFRRICAVILGLCFGIWVLYFFVTFVVIREHIGLRGMFLALLIPVLITAFTIWRLVTWHRVLKSRRAESYSAQCEGRGFGVHSDEELGLEHSFVDPGAFEADVAKFRAGKLRVSQFWLRLDELVEQHVVSRAERRQLFLGLYHQSTEALERRHSLFSPQNSFWAEQDDSAVEETDAALSWWSSIDVERSCRILLPGWFKLLSSVSLIMQLLLHQDLARKNHTNALGFCVMMIMSACVLCRELWQILEKRLVERRLIDTSGAV